MKYRGILLMFLSVLLFAGINTCVKFLSDLPTHEIVFFRSTVQLILSAGFVLYNPIPFFGNNIKWLVIRGISGTIALFCFFYTLQQMPMASATTIQYLSPIFTILLAIAINNQKVKPIQWLFFTLAFIGILMIKGFDPRVTMKLLSIGVFSALLTGVSYNAIMKCRETDHPVTLVMYFQLVAFPVMGIWTFFDWVMPNRQDWILLLAIALLSQGAQVAMAKALHADDASKVTPVKYFGSVIAVVIGYTVFDERLNLLSAGGIVLVLVGVLLNSRVKPIKIASTTGA